MRKFSSKLLKINDGLLLQSLLVAAPPIPMQSVLGGAETVQRRSSSFRVYVEGSWGIHSLSAKFVIVIGIFSSPQLVGTEWSLLEERRVVN